MEDTNVERGSAAGRLTWLWMLLAMVSIGVFLVWLGATSEPTQVTVVEGPEEDPSIVTVPVDTFATRSDSYAGLEVRLRGIQVASRLGSQLFWTQLPGEQPGITVPYLFALDPALVADPVTIQSGDMLTVVGQVRLMTDSLLTRWVETGVIMESQRVEAQFATSFFEVREVRRPESGGPSDDS